MKLRHVFALIAPLLLSISAHAADATLAVSASVPEALQLVINGKNGGPIDIQMTNDPLTGLQDVSILIQILTNSPGKVFDIYLSKAAELKSGTSTSLPLTLRLPHGGSDTELKVGSARFGWNQSFFPNGANTIFSTNGLATSNEVQLTISQTQSGPLHAGIYTGTIQLMVAVRP